MMPEPHIKIFSLKALALILEVWIYSDTMKMLYKLLPNLNIGAVKSLKRTIIGHDAKMTVECLNHYVWLYGLSAHRFENNTKDRITMHFVSRIPQSNQSTMKQKLVALSLHWHIKYEVFPVEDTVDYKQSADTKYVFRFIRKRSTDKLRHGKSDIIEALNQFGFDTEESSAFIFSKLTDGTIVQHIRNYNRYLQIQQHAKRLYTHGPGSVKHSDQMAMQLDIYRFVGCDVKEALVCKSKVSVFAKPKNGGHKFTLSSPKHWNTITSQCNRTFTIKKKRKFDDLVLSTLHDGDESDLSMSEFEKSLSPSPMKKARKN